MPTTDLDAANEHSEGNRAEVLASERCGCFCCGAIFPSTAVWNWLDHKEPHTAFCPQCGINSVLGDASGLPITLEFLREMNERWFDGTLWGEGIDSERSEGAP